MALDALAALGKQFGTELGSSLAGDVEKAILVIHDYRTRGNQALAQNPTISETTTVNGVTSTTTRARTAKNVGVGFSQNRIATMANPQHMLPSVAELAEAAMQGQSISFPDAEDKLFYVQYNPSHLTLNVSTPPPGNVTNVVDGRALLDINGTAKLQLTVELLFDAMDVYDSFMWDKFTASVLSSPLNVSAIANAANMVKDLKGDRNAMSVQPEVEALLSALRNPFTRTVSFRWADFAFIGTLETVRATYTMFSPSGRPVRAKAMIRITHEMDPDMLKSFLDSRDLMFGNYDVGNLTNTSQNWENLLNLNF